MVCPSSVSGETTNGSPVYTTKPNCPASLCCNRSCNLNLALVQAGELIKQAGSQTGQILVLTAHSPSLPAVNAAKRLAHAGIDTSIIPVLGKPFSSALFEPLASAGHGHVISFTDTTADLEQWLTVSRANQRYGINLQNDIPIWRDQGRWFLIPVLLFLLPVFRRGWLQRINT